MSDPRILLLTTDSASARMVFHYLRGPFRNIDVVFEKKESRLLFINRRIRKLGVIPVAGQVLFQALMVPLLKLFSAKRQRHILSEFNLDLSPIPDHNIRRIQSVNSRECHEIISDGKYDVVVVHGTRIISKEILDLKPGRFINIHAGITPYYRGVHGMYWALVSNDKEHAGVTIHLVDAGIDSGKILFSEKVTHTKEDNFITYPYLQLATGLPLLVKAIREISEGKELEKKSVPVRGKLWHHPAIWTYIRNRLTKKIR